MPPTRPFRINRAFVGAGDNAGNIAAHADIQRLRRIRHDVETLQALGNAAVDVLLRKRFGRGAEDGDLRRSGFHRRIESLQIGVNTG